MLIKVFNIEMALALMMVPSRSICLLKWHLDHILAVGMVLELLSTNGQDLRREDFSSVRYLSRVHPQILGANKIHQTLKLGLLDSKYSTRVAPLPSVLQRNQHSEKDIVSKISLFSSSSHIPIHPKWSWTVFQTRSNSLLENSVMGKIASSPPA